MAAAILATKLVIPPLRSELVTRPRLLERLDEGLECKLTLVSAPAGYGKTSLLSMWAKQCPLPAAWLSLDEEENDLSRFLSYLVTALRQVQPGIGESLLAKIHSPATSSRVEWVSALINEIAQIPQPFVLILDDFHLVESQMISESIGYLLEHLPAQMHLVIATRADPQLPLARLRARGQLVEIRLSELRFVPAEEEQFLNQVMHLGLTHADMSAVDARTEGWIAGLQMTAVTCKARSDRQSFIQAFTGSNRFILDYLIEEVLQHQPEEVRLFLLQTSILDRMTGALCDAVTGRTNSQEILDNLQRANLFILALDEQGQWYRYHQLFLDLLRSHARFSPKVEIGELHRKASQWYEQNGCLEDAIDQILRATVFERVDDFERAAILIEKVAQPTLMRSEITLFLSWLKDIPENIITAHPELCAFRAWGQLMSGEALEVIEQGLKHISLSSDLFLGKLATIRAYAAFLDGKVSSAHSLLQQALQHLPEEDRLYRYIAAWLWSNVFILSGNFSAGQQALGRIIHIAQQSGDVLVASAGLCQQAEIHIRLAQLHQARDDYEQALVLSTDAGGRHLPIAAKALMGMGELLREWNKLDAAAQHCLEAIDLTQHIRSAFALSAYLSLARIRQAQGDISGADENLKTAWEIARQTDLTLLDDLAVMLIRTQLWLARGKYAGVERWVRERGLDIELAPLELDQVDDYINYHLRKYEYLVMARWLIACNQPQTALSVLDVILKRMVEQGRVRLEIEAVLIQAMAHQKMGNLDLALSCLQHGLAIARPEHFVRLFLDEGKGMFVLLEESVRRRIEADYAGKLLAEFAREPALQVKQPARQVPGSFQGLAEPLSERELEVMRHLATGQSTAEIAARLYIAESTLRSHIKNIYAKLNAHHRSDAVQRARDLKIL